MATLKSKKTTVRMIGVASLVALVVGSAIWREALSMTIGLATIGVGLLGTALWWRWSKRTPASRDESSESTNEEQQNEHSHVAQQGGSTGELVDQLMAEGRYALLLRPQIIDNLSPQQVTSTVALLEELMALVPPGDVSLACGDNTLEDVPAEEETRDPIPIRTVAVAPLFIDRYPVANRQFQQFVDGGGYDQMALWDEEIWPAVLDFVDTTGEPGPRYWSDGRFEEGKGDHPVVGVCWYEAAAFARWSGKRLPSDAEWIKAGSWPVAVSPGNLSQRRYPWGNSFEPNLANLWGFGLGETVSVEEFADGVSVGGVFQLIGNVWEWTSTAYGDPEDTSLLLTTPMKSIRGGAYDTYFENQATCHFQSGENPVDRKHNIGFRLALGACDLAPSAAQLALEGITQHDQAATA